jgi:hypothetical protein
MSFKGVVDDIRVVDGGTAKAESIPPISVKAVWGLLGGANWIHS